MSTGLDDAFDGTRTALKNAFDQSNAWSKAQRRQKDSFNSAALFAG
jgi:hypothetical protein